MQCPILIAIFIWICMEIHVVCIYHRFNGANMKKISRIFTFLDVLVLIPKNITMYNSKENTGYMENPVL